VALEGEGEVPTFGRFLRLRPSKEQIRDAAALGIITVKDDEQRGFDPVSGREILQPCGKVKTGAAGWRLPSFS
jgi:hypothetical protein